MVDRLTLPEETFLDGSYRIVRVVGAGGFGITYEAVDINLGTRVAIKEYFPLEFGDRDASQTVRPKSGGATKMFEWGRDNFLNEAKTLAGFDHPGIVRVLRVFEANATAYMVMRFEKGLSFEGWLKSLQRLPTQRELDAITRPLLDALEEMHAVNYLHRDIAPDNIVIRPDGTPVLLDFGSARHVVAEKSRAITGIVKAGYSPQEQYASDNRHQGPWTDIYAFGGTLYRAVAGKRPIESMLRFDESNFEPAAEIAKGDYRTPFLEAIDKSLSVRPSQRHQSVAELREGLFRPEATPTLIIPQLPAPEPKAEPSRPFWNPQFLDTPRVREGALAALVVVGVMSGLKVAHHFQVFPMTLFARPAAAPDDAAASTAAANAKRTADLEAERQRADAEKKRLADIEAESQRAEAEKKRVADAEAARLKVDAERKRVADIEAERQRAEAEKKRVADAEAARLKAEAERKRVADLEAERQRVEAEQKKVADAEAARLRAETERKRVADLEAERQRAEVEKKKVADAEAARLKADAEKKRVADLEIERQRVEAEKKKVADAEAARLKADAEKKRVADVEAERLKLEGNTSSVSRQDGGRQGPLSPASPEFSKEEFLASYRELLRNQQCSVGALTLAQLEKSVPYYIEGANKARREQIEKINLLSASRANLNQWLEKANASKGPTCPFDPSAAVDPPAKPATPVYKAPPVSAAPRAPQVRAPQAPSQRPIMGIQ